MMFEETDQCVLTIVIPFHESLRCFKLIYGRCLDRWKVAKGYRDHLKKNEENLISLSVPCSQHSYSFQMSPTDCVSLLFFWILLLFFRGKQIPFWHLSILVELIIFPLGVGCSIKMRKQQSLACSELNWGEWKQWRCIGAIEWIGQIFAGVLCATGGISLIINADSEGGRDVGRLVRCVRDVEMRSDHKG